MRTSVSPGAAECPHAPAAPQSTQARALHRACLVLGGLPSFAVHMGVAEETLRRWMEGLEAPGRPD